MFFLRCLILFGNPCLFFIFFLSRLLSWFYCPCYSIWSFRDDFWDRKGITVLPSVYFPFYCLFLVNFVCMCFYPFTGQLRNFLSFIPNSFSFFLHKHMEKRHFLKALALSFRYMLLFVPLLVLFFFVICKMLSCYRIFPYLIFFSY